MIDVGIFSWALGERATPAEVLVVVVAGSMETVRSMDEVVVSLLVHFVVWLRYASLVSLV